MQSEDPTTRRAAVESWAKYEIKVSRLHFTDEELVDPFGDWNPLAFSLIENHYMANRCFLEEEQLLRDAGRIKGIPVTLVNGRYDVVCPPITAYRLHKRLPGSKLVIVESAGHSVGEPGIRQALLHAVAEFE
jgi:proline iminopeptidase